tara:strand:+ start:1607 stop:1756 length:150 start_codon:yes stop_codon:yes gene_type:complete
MRWNIIFNKIMLILGMLSISLTQNQGDIYLVELMEIETAEEIKLLVIDE